MSPQDPLCAGLMGQHDEALTDGVGGRAFRTKAIGVWVGCRLRETGSSASRYNACMARHFITGIPRRPQFSVGLRDVDTSQRLRLISTPSQHVDGPISGRRSSPDRSVHSRRVLALVVRHSFHSQSSTAERAGQQPLQGFHLALTAFLCCLDDTRLQSPDPEFALRPVDLFPLLSRTGGCTHGWCHVHLRFPPAKILKVLSSTTTSWKSACFRSRVILQPLSAPLQSGICFLQPPLPAAPTACLAASPAPERAEHRAYLVSLE